MENHLVFSDKNLIEENGNSSEGKNVDFADRHPVFYFLLCLLVVVFILVGVLLSIYLFKEIKNMQAYDEILDYFYRK